MTKSTIVLEPEVLDRVQAAALIGVTPATLARWARRDVGPRWHKAGKHRGAQVKFVRADIMAWIAAGMDLTRRGSRPAGLPKFEPPASGPRRRGPDGRFVAGAA
jgi:hypothetical protein